MKSDSPTESHLVTRLFLLLKSYLFFLFSFVTYLLGLLHCL